MDSKNAYAAYAVGVYVRAPFAEMIVSGAKPYETRNRRTLHALVGRLVFIIETGHGAPTITGVAVITGAEIVPYDDVEMRERAQIIGTEYDIAPGGAKWFYHLEHARRFPDPIPAPARRVNHGRTWCHFAWEDFEKA